MLFESDLLVAEAERYSRQVIVPGIDIEGQKRLRDARVLVVGCGGLGSPAIMYLSSCGVGSIGLVDFDRVEGHNLQRQIIYSEDDVSEYKVVVAAGVARKMNSALDITTYNEFLDESNVENILSLYEIVLDCTDNIRTRYLLSDHCRATGKSLICGSVLRWEGQLYKITPSGPCYRCLFPDVRDRALSCEDGGVIGPVCGMIGSLQALEAIRLVMGDYTPKMAIYDGIRNRLTNIKVREPQEGCSACRGDMASQRHVWPRCKENVETDLDSEVIPTMDWADVLSDFDSYFFIDVRSPIQYRMFRVRGSRNIPLGHLPREIESIRMVKKRVGVVCKRGVSSRKGTALLRSHGIDAFSINCGIDGFKSCLRRMDDD